VRAGAPHGHACVSVSDQGIGIPQASLGHLFERFYRAENAEAQHISGMGVGLFLVKEIVGLHGGAIEVNSTEGAGSTFTIRLPHHGPTQQRSEPNHQDTKTPSL
jgi:signal transduction histidine kinase